MRTSARAQAAQRKTQKNQNSRTASLGTGQTRLYQSNHTNHQAHVTYKRQWEIEGERRKGMVFTNPRETTSKVED